MNVDDDADFFSGGVMSFVQGVDELAREYAL
jgi:hypothetical protein